MELLNCPICKNEYKKPITLPCGDSYCEHCIHKTSKKKVFKCEDCIKYFSHKFLDFSVNKKLQLLIPAYKSLLQTHQKSEIFIKSLQQELTDLKSTLSKSLNQEKTLENEINDLRSSLYIANTQIDLQKRSISELGLLLDSSTAEKNQLKRIVKDQEHDFFAKSIKIEEEKERIEKNRESLEELKNNLFVEQQRLVETEKKLEKKIGETIKFCNDKHSELNVRFREVELKELLCNRKEKKRFETEQMCEKLAKDLELVLSSQKVINKVSEGEEIRVRSELRPVKASNLRASSRHKSTHHT